MDSRRIIADRYRIVKSVSGGMGIVHFCIDTQDNDYPLALKTFKPEYLSDHRIRDRFLREATIWIELGSHQNIVQAYKVFHNSNDHSVYLIMELIPAPLGSNDPSLRSFIANNPIISYEKSLTIILGIVRGMKYAVSILPSIVHRDLKPENILLGANTQPKITDFGLAGVQIEPILSYMQNSTPPYKRNITNNGIVGTPCYMSPEQWKGQQVDCRSDIYAVGCILYELIIGELAVQANSIEELMAAHISGMALRNVNNANLKPSIRNLLQKCVHPQSDGRFGNWQEFEKEVEILLKNEFHVEIPDNLILTDVSSYGQYQKSESMLAIGAAYINLGEFIIGQSYFEKAYSIAKKHGFKVLQGLAHANIGVSLSSQGDFVNAIRFYENAINLFVQLNEQNQIINHTGNIGNAYLGLHDLDKAFQYIEKAYKMSKDIGDLHGQAIWLGNLGNVYLAQSAWDKALETFQLALSMTINSKDRISVCMHLGGISSAFAGMGNFRKASENCNLALSEAQRIGDQHTIGLLYCEMGNIQFKQNQYDEGINSFATSIDIAKRVNDKYLLLKATVNLANCFVCKNRVENAKPLLEDAMKTAYDIGAIDVRARAEWSLGIIDQIQGSYGDAILHLRNAVVDFKTQNMPEYFEASKYLLNVRKKLGLL